MPVFTTMNSHAQPRRPSGPSLLRLAGPLIVSFWMRSAFTFVDTAYAATIGDSAVAAIGLTAPFEFLMIALWVGLSTGLTSALSRAMGARQSDKIEQYRRLAWKMVVAVSAVFAALGAGIWFAAPGLDLESAVRHDFRIYGSVLIAGSAFTTFWSVIPDSIVKAHHDTRATMWAGIWSNVINVVLNTLFLFAFGWGVFGIALSTVLGRIGGLWYALAQARRHEDRRKETSSDVRSGLDARPYRSLLVLAIPSSLSFGLMAAESALVNGLLTSVEQATEAIAAYSIFYRTVLFALNPVIATGVAMLPFAARRFGEGDVEGVRRALRDSALGTVIYSLALVGPLMLLGAPPLAEMLAESPTTRAYTVFGLRLVPLVCLAGAPFLLCRPVFESMNRGAPGLAISTLRYVVLTGPLAWLGMRASRALDEPAFYGLLAGLLTAAAMSSIVFAVWLARALSAEAVEPSAVRRT